MKKLFKKPIIAIISITLALAVFVSSTVGVLVVTGILDKSFLTDIIKTFSGNGDNQDKVPDDEPDYPDMPDYSEPDSPWIPEGEAPSVNTGYTTTSEIGEVFHDQGGIYMSPIQPKSTERATMRLRVERNNVTWAKIHISDDYGKSWVSYPLKYNAIEKNGNFEDWAIMIPKQADPYYYYFSIGNEGEETTQYYGIYGMTTDKITSYSDCFFVRPDSDVPEWSYGKYWYGINTNAFYNADPMNDPSGQYIDMAVGQQMNGNHYRAMFGGDLQGVLEKLDHIKDLGVDGVYLNPLMPSWDAAGYGWLETYSIASRNGNEEALANLCKALHDSDMRIMLDNVVALWPGNSVWANDPNYNIYPFEGSLASKTSRYFDMFFYNMWPGDYLKRFESIAPDYSGTNAKKAVYSEKGSLIPRYNSNPFNVDAIRYDSSVYIWGSDTPSEQIVKEMQTAAKNANPNHLFIGENDKFRYYDWDTTWNLHYADAQRDIFTFKTTFSQYKKNAIKYMQSINRASALSTYNYIDMIDRDRMRTTVKTQWLLNAGTIVQMTYLGSPSLRFGNEVASESTMSHRLNAFNWDETTWNYENYNMVKTLGQLRNEYDCLKTGVIKWGEIKDSEQFMSFARFDNKNTVITAINRTEDIAEHTIEVRQFGIKDGEVLTDYFTGNCYTVKNGTIKANILAGGTVFVTGGKTADYRYQYEINKFDVKNSTVNTLSQNSYKVIANNGDLSGKKDKAIFATTPAFGGFGVEANITVNGGSAALVVRSSNEANAKSYSAVVNNGKLTVYARAKDGDKPTKLTTISVKDGSKLEIVRNSSNNFVLYLSGSKVAKTNANIEMGNKVYAGFAGLDGTAKVNNIAVNGAAAKYCSDFNSSVLPATLNLSGNGTLNNGKLVLESNNAIVSKEAICYADTKEGDWTAKTTFTSEILGSSSIAGIVAKSSDNNNVFGGRALIDGKQKIVLARIVNGELAVYASVDDTKPNDSITIQLQRAGNYFTLIYRYGNSAWKQIDGRIFTSMTNPMVGPYINGTSVVASFDSFTLGNMLDGGTSVNTPHSIIAWSTKTAGQYNNTSFATPSWKVTGNVDNWDYVSGGIEQSSKTVDEYLYDVRSEHTDFRAEGTIQFKSKTGYVGMLLRKVNTATDMNNGYLVKLNHDGKLQLLRGSTVLAETEVEIPKMGLRLVAECSGNTIAVYYGTNLELAFTVQDSTYMKGYFGFMTSKENAIIGNFDISLNEYKAWTAVAPNYPGDGNIWRFSADAANLKIGESYAVASYKGYAYTDVDASVEITATQDETGYSGLTFGLSEGILPKDKGVSVAINGNNSLVILKNGENVASADVTISGKVQLKVTVRDGKYTVYLDGNKTLEWTDSEFNGGVVSLSGYNTTAEFKNFIVTDKTNG